MEPFDLFEEAWKKEKDIEPEERVWTIYLHTVPKEFVEEDHDMYYVGVTSGPVKDRWKNGLGYQNQYFGKQIQDINWNNIQHEIIAEHLTKQEVSNMEKAMIKALNSNDEKYGYNKTGGGGLRELDTNIDLTGQVFERLTVLHRNPQFHNEWICECSCDNHTIISVKTYELFSGNTKSCGCYHADLARERHFKHGMTDTPLHGVWSNMRNHDTCKEWDDDFLIFYNWAIQNGYKQGLILLRYDLEEEYNPDNCFWGTIHDKNRKRKSNTYYTYNGKTQTLQDWANELGINRNTLRNRLLRSKMSVEKAFSLPVEGNDSPSYNKAYLYEYKGETHTLREFSEIYQIDLQRLRNRFRESGRDIYKTLNYLLEGSE